MPGSAAVDTRLAVTDGLRTHLAALPAFGQDADEVEVTYAWKRDSEATQQVYTGRSRADTPPAAMRAGRNIKDETGLFDLTVLVRRPGDSAEDADRRAFEIGVQIEEWVGDRKSNQLGVTGLQTLTIVSWAADYRAGADGAIAILTYVVRWTARIT